MILCKEVRLTAMMSLLNDLEKHRGRSPPCMTDLILKEAVDNTVEETTGNKGQFCKYMVTLFCQYIRTDLYCLHVVCNRVRGQVGRTALIVPSLFFFFFLKFTLIVPHYTLRCCF